MKYKKYSYILVLILMLVVGINKTYAEESQSCYYISQDNSFKASLKMSWGYFGGPNLRTLNDYALVSVDKISKSVYEFDDEVIANWTKADGWDHFNNWYDQCTHDGKVCFNPYYGNETEANKATNPLKKNYVTNQDYVAKTCPKYLVFQKCGTYYIWATENESKAKLAVQHINDPKKNCTGAYATFEKNGRPITAEEYYDEFVDEGLIDFDKVKDEPTCKDYEAIFGDKNNPESIRYLINQVLGYVRIIVPILIILLGTIDFAKAVLAGKEDNMKKAQNDFIRRLIAGVAVFLVPTLVDIIMSLADIVWSGQYTSCPF